MLQPLRSAGLQPLLRPHTTQHAVACVWLLTRNLHISTPVPALPCSPPSATPAAGSRHGARRIHTTPPSSPSTPTQSHSPAAPTPTPAPRPYLTRSFWRCKHTWRRAGVNTFRCLVGCSIGDLGTMAYLMAYHSDIDMGTSMGLSMAAGITTSILLETTLLHLGKDRLPLRAAAKTAMGMSLVSMLAMEFTENLVTLGLSDASTTIASANFWGITALSMMAGFLAPLPYNYLRLKLWGQACH